VTRRVDPDLRPLVRAAEAHGWTVQHGRRHPRLVPPPGWTDRCGEPVRPLVIPCTGSDRRGPLNAASALRRAGVPVPHRGR
jgi:hypothetical protein